ncbi:MAG: uracil-DNA glycosylase [Patescibacteria group bacterium]
MSIAHHEKAHAMRALEEEIIAKDITPELSQQAIQLVMGDGNLDTDIFIIGEAPGKDEDEQGIPFVGAAGKILNNVLDGAGIRRSDTYVTNIVKYRPPNNRDPKPLEKEVFWPYLVRQIEIVKPKVVITLGRHSMSYFLPKAIIGQVHGQAQQVQLGEQDLTLIPMYHPAATIYNRKLQQTLIDDFLGVPEIIRQK